MVNILDMEKMVVEDKIAFDARHIKTSTILEASIYFSEFWKTIRDIMMDGKDARIELRINTGERLSDLIVYKSTESQSPGTLEESEETETPHQ